MSTAEDFIPQDAEIEVKENYITEDVKNLADENDVKDDGTRDFIISNTLQTVNEYDNRFRSNQDEWIDEVEGIWNLCDAAWRSYLNDSSVQSEKKHGANEPEVWERAQTGSTLYFRQTTQKAANGYAVQTSKEMPFKYEPLYENENVSKDHADMRANKLNLLAKWSMKADKFNIKSIEFWTQLNKYGNIPVMVEWIQKMGRKTIMRPIMSEDGLEVEREESFEYETVVENRPSFRVLPIESVKADSTIGNIQDQECVIVHGVVGLSDIVDGISRGLYRKELLKDLNRSHQWDGTSGFENEDEKKDNRGMENQPTTAASGRYLKWDIFVNLPIDEEEETWDNIENIPYRYRVTLFGNTAQTSAVGRIERNQEPDDTIPIEMIHAKPDDPDLLYHISGFEVIRSNMATETTLIRQIIDNNTLVCKPPLKEVVGEVQGNDRQFRPDQRFKVDNKDSISEFNVRDISQQTLTLVDYLKEDSNRANTIDPNMLGESFGARTSASEANTISSNSRRPNLVEIEYVHEQLFGFYAKRLKVNWEAYGRKDQVVQITDDDGELAFIRPGDITGEYDIVVDIMDDIKDDAAETQKYMNYAQAIAGTPMAQTTDWAGLNAALSEKMLGTSEFVVPNNEGDADANAMQNLNLLLTQGVMPQIADGMNLRKHLDIYKAERIRWQGHEEENPNVALLDQLIQQLEMRVNQPQQPAQAQAAQPTTQEAAQGGGVLSGIQ